MGVSCCDCGGSDCARCAGRARRLTARGHKRNKRNNAAGSLVGPTEPTAIARGSRNGGAGVTRPQGLWESSLVSPEEFERLSQVSSVLGLPPTAADVAFFVPGTPAPQGSKRFFRGASGKSIGIEMSKQLPRWRSDIRDAAERAMAGRDPFGGALEVELRFVYGRPASHLSAKGGIKDSAPRHLATGHDVDKVARGVLDALQVRTGGRVIVDDRCVTRLVASKEYGDRPGCHVAVRRLT